MADDVTLPGTGVVVAADDDGTRQFQWVKLVWGPDNTFNKVDVATGKPLPIQLRSDTGVVLALVDDTAFTPATSVGIPIFGQADETSPDSVDEGDAGGLRMTLDRMLLVQNRSPIVTPTTDITRPADTTTYAAGDNLSNSTSAPTSGGFTLSNAARKSGGSGIITDMIVTSSIVGSTALMLQGEVWIFDQAVTNINDNSAFVISDGEAKTLVGIVPFTLSPCGAAASANNCKAHIQGLTIGFTCVGSADLRYLIQVKNAYVPASSEVITVRAKTLYVD